MGAIGRVTGMGNSAFRGVRLDAAGYTLLIGLIRPLWMLGRSPLSNALFPLILALGSNFIVCWMS